MSHSLQILDIRTTQVNETLYNIGAINSNGDPYWLEFLKPHFDEINISAEVLPLNLIDLEKPWIVNVDVQGWAWGSYLGDIILDFHATIRHALINGNAYLILNHQCEAYTKSFFQTLYEKLENTSLPPSKIIYMVAAADAHREYYEFVVNNNILKEQQITIMYVHHVYKRFPNLTYLDFFNYDRSVKKEKKFLSLNRRWHDHRLALTSLLSYYDLLPLGYVSLGVMPSEINQAKDRLQQLTIALQKTNHTEILFEGFDRIANKLPLKVDQVNLSENQFQTTSLSIDFYQKSYFSLVSSTMAFGYQEQSVGFTEKEVKPILAKHPFLIHNLPGALSHMKNMGFLTFSKWFDESYDIEKDDFNRMNMIALEVKRLSNLSNEVWNNMLDEMYPVLMHNYNRLVKYNTEHCFFNSDLKNLLYYVR